MLTSNGSTGTVVLAGATLETLKAGLNAGDLRIDATEARVSQADISVNAGRVRLSCGPAQMTKATLAPVLLATLASGCAPSPPAATPQSAAHAHAFAASHIRSFSDLLPVTSVADGGAVLWGATPRGLLRWDIRTAQSSRLTTAACRCEGQGLSLIRSSGGD